MLIIEGHGKYLWRSESFWESIRPDGGESQVPIHPKCWLSPDILTRGPSQLGERQLGHP